MSIAEASVRITNPTGLHARPAVKLAQLAAGFDADVSLKLDDGAWIKARSTAKVMKLKARADTTLHFRADGQEAADALDALVAFVERDFDEGPAAAKPDTASAVSAQKNNTAVAGGKEQLISAEVGAAGLARGPVFRFFPAAAVPHYEQGSVEQELQRLERAVRQAGKQLSALGQGQEHGDTDAREIIAFQLALLKDQEMMAPVLAAVGKGVSARLAWQQMLDAEILDYESGEDEYFRARASDLRDLRERVNLLLDGVFDEADPAIQVPQGSIVLTDELPPSQFLQLDWRHLAGIVMKRGSRSGHTAMLARARGVPLLIKLDAELEHIEAGADAILNAQDGVLLINPGAASIAAYENRCAERQREMARARRFLSRSAQTADGLALKVYVNVDDPALLQTLNIADCDGIGLTRTEFLFHGGDELPDEQEQYRVYRSLLEWAQDRPVTIRTLDAGGDKPIAGLTPQGESNPFLGVRGLRLSLARPDVFKVQLRALARAAVHGRLKVMVPMVTVAEEFEQARRLLQAEVAALQQGGLAAAMPAFGLMVEVPAAALSIADFNADFLSIGSNDLIQYTLALGRDCAQLSSLWNETHPAVLELIARVAEQGKKAGIEVSVCGEMAANVDCLAALLNAGVRVLSVPPAALGPVKAALSEIPGGSV